MTSPEPVWPIPMRAIGAQNLLTMPGGVSTSGYLHKKGGSQFSLMKWPLRFIIIHKGCVYYFRSSTSASPQGAFSLNGYNRVMRAAEETTSSNVFPFKIVHFSKKHRTWLFSAASEEERRVSGSAALCSVWRHFSAFNPIAGGYLRVNVPSAIMALSVCAGRPAGPPPSYPPPPVPTLSNKVLQHAKASPLHLPPPTKAYLLHLPPPTKGCLLHLPPSARREPRAPPACSAADPFTTLPEPRPPGLRPQPHPHPLSQPHSHPLSQPRPQPHPHPLSQPAHSSSPGNHCKVQPAAKPGLAPTGFRPKIEALILVPLLRPAAMSFFCSNIKHHCHLWFVVCRLFRESGDCPDGLYAIRNSGTKTSKVLVVWDISISRARNYRLFEENGCVFLDRELTFPSLAILIEHYYSSPLPQHGSLCLQRPYTNTS
uniref:SH3 domain-binding protein 2 n=1 Tax=Neogobius melanostomus TaxID=47308 RepID=A0A8C6WZ74_9GOBI